MNALRGCLLSAYYLRLSTPPSHGLDQAAKGAAPLIPSGPCGPSRREHLHEKRQPQQPVGRPRHAVDPDGRFGLKKSRGRPRAQPPVARVNDPHQEKVVDGQKQHLRPVGKGRVDALREKGEVKDDEGRVADLQHDALPEKPQGADLFLGHLPMLAFKVRQTQGKGLGLELFVSEVKQKEDPRQTHGVVDGEARGNDHPQPRHGNQAHHKRSRRHAHDARLRVLEAIAHGIGQGHEHPGTRRENRGDGRQKKDPVKVRVEHGVKKRFLGN